VSGKRHRSGVCVRLNRRSTSPRATAVAGVRAVHGGLADCDGGIAQLGAGDFGGVLSGIVEVLAVVPISGCKVLSSNSDGSRPSGASTY
jgi:hypothetical protein